MHRRSGAPRFIDKMPNNFPNAGFIATILPNAKIIDARRHPLDACLSCYRQLFAKGQAFTYDLTEIGEYYLQYQRMMDHWARVMPGSVLTDAVRGSRRGLRGARSGACSTSAGCRSRSVPPFLRERPPRADAELGAGAPADLRALGRPLAPITNAISAS
jgi:hypothetical protein